MGTLCAFRLIPHWRWCLWWILDWPYDNTILSAMYEGVWFTTDIDVVIGLDWIGSLRAVKSNIKTGRHKKVKLNWNVTKTNDPENTNKHETNQRISSRHPNTLANQVWCFFSLFVALSYPAVTLNSSYAPNVPSDYGGELFQHESTVLCQLDLCDKHNKLVHPGQQYSTFRPGTVIMVCATLHTFV